MVFSSAGQVNLRRGTRRTLSSPFFSRGGTFKLYLHAYLPWELCFQIICKFFSEEKCLVKSWHSCVPVIFSSSRVIVETGQKSNIPVCSNKGRVQLLEAAAQATSFLTASELKLTVQHAVVSGLLHSVDQMLWNLPAYYLSGGLRCFLVGCGSKPCCHLRCVVETWDLGDGRVYSAVNHHVWCGLSGRVRGEMPAKCSHHDLMRWFSCSSAPSTVLCNSDTPTQQFPRPACVTSAFVRIRHVARNPEKHVERLL